MNRDYSIYIVDAFASKPFQGNPAGVVMMDENMTEEEMKKISKELGIPETAFVESLDSEEFRVRFFTPVGEADSCGHATLGTFYTMAKMHYIRPIDEGTKKIIQHTVVGKFPIYIDYENGLAKHVTIEQQPAEEFGPLKDVEKLAEALSISVKDIGIVGYNVVPEIISTGYADVMVPVKNREILEAIKPDFDKIIELNKAEDFYSVHVFYLDDEKQKTYQRNFCPILEIYEESATGTSTGAMIYYLVKNNLLDESKVTAVQGIEMGRPSQLYAEVVNDKGKESIRVGGKAVVLVDGILELR